MNAAKFSCFAIVLAFAASQTQAQQATPWGSLPKATVGALRIQNTQKIVDSLRDETKLGAMLFSKERIATINKLMREGDPDAWEAVQQQLSQYNLSVDLLLKLTTANIGVGVIREKHVAADRADDLYVVLAWVQADAKLLTRLRLAMDKGLEENKGQLDAPKRTDIDLAGHRVVHLVTDKRGSGAVQIDFDNPLGGGAVAPRRDANVKVDDDITDQNHLLMTQIKDRLLFAISIPSNAGYVKKLRDAGKPVDMTRVTSIAKTQAIFSQFLKSLDGAGEVDGFAKTVSSAPGMAEALPTGVAWMEGYVQAAPLVAMLEKLKPGLNDKLGIGRLGMIGTRTTVEGGQVRSGSFVQLTGPHTGLMQSLIGARSPAVVPAWVPADVGQYGHMELDLGKVYKAVGEIDFGSASPQVMLASVAVEGFAATLAKTDFASVLSSLGTRHSLLIFNGEGMQDLAQPQNRIAIVWQPSKVAVWDGVLENLQKQQKALEEAAKQAKAQGQPGQGQNLPFKIIEKPNYKIIRFEDRRRGTSVGIYVGKRHIIVATTDAMADRIFGSIASPPQGLKALINTPAYKSAAKLLPVEEGLSLQYSNLDAVLGEPLLLGLQMVRAGLDDDAAGGDIPKDLIRKLLPTEAELKGAFGATASQTYVTGQGIVTRSIWQLPPAQ